MRNVGSLSFLLILLLPTGMYAQSSPAIQWQKCYGGSSKDIGNCIINTFDGGYAICGNTFSNDGDVSGNHGGSDCWVVKLNSSGKLVWQKCLGGSNDDGAASMIQTSDGGYIVTGFTKSSDGDLLGISQGNSINGDMWIIKLDTGGAIAWQKIIGKPGTATNPIASSIIQTFDNGFVISGAGVFGDEGCPSSFTKAIVMKFDSSGNEEWHNCYGALSAATFGGQIIQTLDSGYAFAGSTEGDGGDVSGFHGGLFDGWLVKLNRYGSLEWQRCLGGSGNDGLRSLFQTEDSGFVAAGYTNSTDGDVSGMKGGSDVWVVKVSSSGNLEWQRCYGGTKGAATNFMKRTADRGFFICATTNSNDGDVTGLHSKDTNDIWLIKLNSAGALQWQKCLGGTNDDEGSYVIQNRTGAIVIAGYTGSNDGDVSGNHAVGNIVGDIWVVQLTPEDGVETEASPYLGLANYFNIYPNPSSTQVHLQMEGDQPVQRVKLYDLIGRDVTPSYELAGNMATVNVNGLTNGIYIARLTFRYIDYTGTFTRPLVVQH